MYDVITFSTMMSLPLPSYDDVTTFPPFPPSPLSSNYAVTYTRHLPDVTNPSTMPLLTPLYYDVTNSSTLL